MPRRSSASVLAAMCVGISAALSITGCATAHQRELMQKQEAEERAKQLAYKQSQITVSVPANADQVTARVLSAFVEHGLSVNASQPHLIEAKLPRETTLFGSYDIVARAVIVPMDSATQVTLFGEETKLAQGIAPQSTVRLSDWSGGRAKEVWATLQQIAHTLQPDSTLVTKR